MDRKDFACLGLAIFIFLIVVGFVLLVAYLFGWLTLVWWLIYLVLCVAVGTDERIPYRLMWAILIGAPIIVGIVGLLVAGLRGGLGGVLPVLLLPAAWLIDKLTD